ncbi:MAG TPA: L-histidine N(alpha)-methyltransferase [Polyangia bacterium]|nr:L-histidine N(alpha)-methyltransferase [Polyangia bacterium]
MRLLDTHSSARPGAGSPAALDVATLDAVAAAARDGLLGRPKRLPPWLLYDERGSALFDEITRLPEYYPTRTERAILAREAAAIVSAVGTPVEVVELGSGSAEKTQLLLAELQARQRRVVYVPVDVSPTALGAAAERLRRHPRLRVRPLVARYPEELGLLGAPDGARRLVLFLGSNIGNYDPAGARALLAGVGRSLRAGDALLLGADLRKARGLLLRAYDDARGVTARFNLNLLVRLNRELGARFDVGRFRHVARWNARRSRMEMLLESATRQRVVIDALGAVATFARGERIHTESSYKLTTAGVRALLARAGFRLEARWHDPRRWFGVYLARRLPAGR